MVTANVKAAVQAGARRGSLWAGQVPKHLEEMVPFTRDQVVQHFDAVTEIVVGKLPCLFPIGQIYPFIFEVHMV